MKKKLVLIAMILSFSLMSSFKAHALSIRLTQGAFVQTCTDISDGTFGCDAFRFTNGAMSFSTTIGVFDVTTTSGFSFPYAGTTSASVSQHLGSIVGTSSTAGTLIVELSQQGYTGLIDSGIAKFISGLGGSSATGVATYSASIFIDATNALYGQGNNVGSIGTLSGISFAGNSVGSASTGTPFSVTQIITITHSGAGSSSADLTTTSVPEPATLLLLGTGLVGLGFFGRRKNSLA